MSGRPSSSSLPGRLALAIDEEERVERMTLAIDVACRAAHQASLADASCRLAGTGADSERLQLDWTACGSRCPPGSS